MFSNFCKIINAIAKYLCYFLLLIILFLLFLYLINHPRQKKNY